MFVTKVKESFLEVFRFFFTLDKRSLALCRMLLALVILFDYLFRLPDWHYFSSDLGFYPRKTWWLYHQFHPISIHYLFDGAWWYFLLMTLHLVAAFTLFIGYRTRTSTFVCWFLTLSLHLRCPLVLNSGDDLTRLFLLWLIFLPAGDQWSLDAQFKAKQNPDPSPSNSPRLFNLKPPLSYHSWGPASAIFFLQLICMYYFAGILKTDPIWRLDHLGIYYALMLDVLVTPLGSWLNESFYTFFTFLTPLILLWEEGGWLLFFIPWKSYRLRTIAIFIFISMHLGFSLTLHIGLFSLTAITYLIALLPSSFWGSSPAQKLAHLLDRLFQKLAISLSPSQASKPDQPDETTQKDPIGKLMLNLFFAVMVLLGASKVLTGHTTLLSRVPLVIDHAGTSLGMSQTWSMFSPKPLVNDYWLAFKGELQDGSVTDLYWEQPFTLDKPSYYAGKFRSQRWRKYFENISSYSHTVSRGLFIQALIRNWNQSHPPSKKVHKITLYKVTETTLKNFQTAPLKTKVLEEVVVKKKPSDPSKPSPRAVIR